MATKKATATAKKSQAQGETNDGPLLDTINAAVKKMIARGKQRGFVTYDELNSALPHEQVSSEQIEDTMSMLSESGVNVVESEETDDAGENIGDNKLIYLNRLSDLIFVIGRCLNRDAGIEENFWNQS